jgi:hypothetical protein
MGNRQQGRGGKSQQKRPRQFTSAIARSVAAEILASVCPILLAGTCISRTLQRTILQRSTAQHFSALCNLKAVLAERKQPREENRLPNRPLLVFQMQVPGCRHHAAAARELHTASASPVSVSARAHVQPRPHRCGLLCGSPHKAQGACETGPKSRFGAGFGSAGAGVPGGFTLTRHTHATAAHG